MGGNDFIKSQHYCDLFLHAPCEHVRVVLATISWEAKQKLTLFLAGNYWIPALQITLHG